MSKVKKKAALAIVLTIVVLVVIFFASYLYHATVYLKSEPLKVRIINEDNKTHNIKIKVFYKNNEIYDKVFNLIPKNKISTEDITKKKGKYKIVIILDNKIRKSFIATAGFSYSTVDVFIINKSSNIKIEIYQKVY